MVPPPRSEEPIRALPRCRQGAWVWLARCCSTITTEVQFGMRLILALLLLLQLDPVIGAALCLEREHAASAECAMPERSGQDARTLAPAGAQVEGGCSVAQLCAQPAPLIAQVGETFQLVSVVHQGPAPLDVVSAPSGILSPPFHPPRV